MKLGMRFRKGVLPLAVWMAIGFAAALPTHSGCSGGRDLTRPARVDLEHHQGEPSTSGLGQIAGRVTDAETGTPLKGANVWIPKHRLGAVTDLKGFFRIAHVPPGDNTVQVRLICYHDFEFELNLSPGETVRADIAIRRYEEGEMIPLPIID
jgi:hypothetical protein